jgi:adenine-specific DNA-methyltransferase
VAKHTPTVRLAPALLRHARNSRSEPTAAEKRVWAAVRDHQLGVHIRRQQALLGRFIPDFYCAQARLCIEIDGDTHAELGMPEYDAERTALLEARGYRVIRFSNQEVLTNLPAVVDAIRAACEPLPPQPAS